jgi:AcrR family transcriptional regulator
MKTRGYRMSARAVSAAATGARILDAVEALFFEAPGHDATLDEIAERAGVSVQTVIRRFGGREGVFAAAVERASARIGSERDAAPVGDLDGALTVLMDHYEQLGDATMRMHAEEARNTRVAELIAAGRASHVDWCDRVFSGPLSRLRGAPRARRLAQLVAVCDVYTWKLLRRDRGLSRAQTQLAVRELLEPLVKES